MFEQVEYCGIIFPNFKTWYDFPVKVVDRFSGFCLQRNDGVIIIDLGHVKYSRAVQAFRDYYNKRLCVELSLF